MTTGPDVKFVAVGEVELAYTTMGDPQAPPVLLFAGLGGQLISWDDRFCQLLVDRGCGGPDRRADRPHGTTARSGLGRTG
jgi:pimeloyl-ACP methyl ester carboxylesterase